MNISEELKDIDSVIKNVQEEIRRLKFFTAFIKNNTQYDEDTRKMVLQKISRTMLNAADSFSAKSMDINVQLENKDYSIKH